jgi:hypothetical protein
MPVSAIVAKQGSSLLPPDLHQRVHLRMLAIPRQGARRALDLSLSVREAVGAVARAEASVAAGGRTMTVHGSLALGQPDAERHAQGTLTLRIEDNLGNAVDRSYPATGKVWVDGETVAIQAGVELPSSKPVPPHVLRGPLEVELPGSGAELAVTFQITPQVAVDMLNETE